MIIETTRFGKVEVGEDQVLTITNGLLGFSGIQLFTLLDDEVGSPFKWLQSIDNEALAFVAIDPDIAFSDYTISLSDEQFNKLQADKVEDLHVLVIVTMTKDINSVTANLQGPLVVNFKKRIGMQIVIPDGKFSTRHKLFGDKLKLNQEVAEESATSKTAPQQNVVG